MFSLFAPCRIIRTLPLLNPILKRSTYPASKITALNSSLTVPCGQHSSHGHRVKPMSIIVKDAADCSAVVQITIEWKGKPRNFQRNKSEAVGQTLVRIGSSLQQDKALNASETEKGKAKPPLNVYLQRKDGSVVDASTPCGQSLLEAHMMIIDSEKLSIIRNPPRATYTTVDSCAIVGLPIFPMVAVEFADISEFKFEWYLTANKAEKLIHSERLYTPKEDDEGSHLEIRAFHPTFPHLFASTIVGPIGAGTEESYRERRIAAFKKLTHDDAIYRILSFNILCPVYVRKPEIAALSFSSCPWDAVDIKYRKTLIAKEILDLDADIFCLQEVSLPLFDYYLSPFFGGYESWITPKLNASEGCASFFRRSKFQLKTCLKFSFIESFGNIEALSSVRDEIKLKWPHFMDRVLPHIKTVYQISVVQRRCNDGLSKNLIVANSHYYFHPKATHIRALQMIVMMHLLEKVRKDPELSDAPIILAGDFNCERHSMGTVLVKSEYIPSTHPDWKFGKEFKWFADTEGLEEKSDGNCELSLDESQKEVEPINANIQKEVPKNDGVELRLPKSLPKLYDCYEDIDVPFTHYVDRFQGTIDYIFVSGDFKPLQCLPVVQMEDIQPYGGLMSRIYPSDHISIAADVKLTQSKAD